MQKNEFEVMVKELLPAVTEQAVEKWTQYAQKLEQIRDYTIENGCDPTDEEYRESAQALQVFRSQREHTFPDETCL